MLKSMTGFARHESQTPWGKAICEIRSVNHRYLEPHFRLPDSCKQAEPKLRDLLKKQCARGKIEVSLSVKLDEGVLTSCELDEDAARKLIALAEKVSALSGAREGLAPLDVLNWPGVLKSPSVDGEAIEKASIELCKETLDQLLAHRVREGAELGAFISDRLNAIEAHVAHLQQALPSLLKLSEQRLREKIEAMDVDVDEARLTQELVFIANKADVAEELDRLSTHVQEARHTLKLKEPIGRRLDFLMQEFNREANTLSSKALNTDTTQIAIDLKVLIEQMREQIQNIE